MHKTYSTAQKASYAFKLAVLYVSDRSAFQLIRSVRSQKLSYLGFMALYDLLSAIKQVEKRKVKGVLIEAGCGMGGSTLVIARAKSQQRDFFVYDTFEMIPPPGEQDGQDAQNRYQQIVSGKSQGIRGGDYYGYLPDLIDQVRQNFSAFQIPAEPNQVHLVQGLFQDTLQVDQPVSFAHIDCDWYESVMTCLARIEPNLSPGGILVIDDYFDWEGCRRAVDEYFSTRREKYKFIIKSRLHIQKIA